MCADLDLSLAPGGAWRPVLGLALISAEPTFLVYAPLCAATIVFTALVVPATKRRELEAISR